VKKYLVIERDRGDEESAATLKTPFEIIDNISMRDCYGAEVYKVFDVSGEAPVELEWHGTWHMSGDPLYIKVTRQDGTIEFDGHGTAH